MLSTKGEKIGHVPEILVKIVAPEMASEKILSLEAEVTESPRDKPAAKWVLGKAIVIPCIYIKCKKESTKKAICTKN